MADSNLMTVLHEDGRIARVARAPQTVPEAVTETFVQGRFLTDPAQLGESVRTVVAVPQLAWQNAIRQVRGRFGLRTF